MKTPPILFSGSMVQAIMTDSKTQTRRLIKPQPKKGFITTAFDFKKDFWCSKRMIEMNPSRFEITELFKPLCKEGDILWVRETWAETINVNAIDEWSERAHLRTDDCDSDRPWSVIIYRADGEWQWTDGDGFHTERSYWKPSIFMPKEAARNFLQVTAVRTEKLQDISEEDAKAEGAKKGVFLYGPNQTKNDFQLELNPHGTYYDGFKYIWHQINGADSWNANPYVWVYNFKRTEKPKNFK